MALISPTVVEQKYGIPATQLRRWRQAGIGPEYFRLGPRSIGYYAADVDDWFEDPANAYLHDVPQHEHAFRHVTEALGR
jgi:predicted DNA-binding transcriptional regulator AlpA